MIHSTTSHYDSLTISRSIADVVPCCRCCAIRPTRCVCAMRSIQRRGRLTPAASKRSVRWRRHERHWRMWSARHCATGTALMVDGALARGLQMLRKSVRLLRSEAAVGVAEACPPSPGGPALWGYTQPCAADTISFGVRRTGNAGGGSVPPAVPRSRGNSKGHPQTMSIPRDGIINRPPVGRV